MVDTIKFSQMTDAGNINNDDKTPGLSGGANVLFNNAWTFLSPGTTAQRPVPSSIVNYRLRFNTDDQLYEYYDAILGLWTQLQESAFTQGPFITYTADPTLPDAQNLGILADGILKQSIVAGVATLDIAVAATDYWAPGNALTRTQVPTVGDDVTNKTYVDGLIVGTVASITGTANQVLANATSGMPQTGAVILTTPQDIDATATPEFDSIKLTGANILDVNDNILIEFAADTNAVNYFGIENAGTGDPLIIAALGSDSDIDIRLFTKGTGIFHLESQNTTNPLQIHSGTLSQHTTNFLFADTAQTRNVTFQDADGTVAYLADIPAVSPSALTRVDDTNVTLTLGGTPSTALLQAVSLTMGWNGQLSLARGGTGKNLTAINGGIVYSDADSFEILAAGTSGQFLQSGGAGAPSWSTATFPSVGGAAGNILISNGTNYIASTSLWPNTVGTAGKLIRSDGATNAYTTSLFADTYSANVLLYASSNNVVQGLASAANGVLVTDGSSVPSISATLPSAVQNNITLLGIIGEDFSVLRSQAGGDVISTVQNGSTSAGSNAFLNVYINNSSTANAVYRAGHVSTQKYSWGFLNSDDSFTFSVGDTLGTGDAFKVSTAGAFSFLNASVTQSVSSSGAAVVFSTANTSNTASSDARITAEVGGTSGGDPYHLFSIPSGTSWTMGADNSDSDAFVLSVGSALGTGNALRCDTTGRFNYPSQPRFFAYKSADTANATGDGTVISPVIYDTEIYDIGGNYNNATGVFTAPITGYYQFEASVYPKNLGALHTTMYAGLIANGTRYNFIVCNPGIVRDAATNALLATGVRRFALTAGQTVQVEFAVFGSTKTVSNGGADNFSTIFSGMLVA